MREIDPTSIVGGLCGLFGKSRQAFYEKDGREANREKNEVFLVEKVLLFRREMPHSGLRKLYDHVLPDLDEKGIKLGRDKFYAMLLAHGLMLKPTRRYHITTISNHKLRYFPNLIKEFVPTASGQLWVCDITYLRVKLTFVYLSLVTDAYSRQIVGYNLHHDLSTEGCLFSLNMALTQFPSDHELIHHSDRGIQYCSFDYVQMLTSKGIKISMSAKASPHQNAIAERLNRTLKHELGLNEIFANYQEASDMVDNAIRIYNTKRPHASCNYLTPAQAHSHVGELPKRWKMNPKTIKRYGTKIPE